MKKKLYILIMCSLFCACDKMPANGNLDGMWQIVEIERNGVTQNIQAEQRYMSIQLKLFMLGEYDRNGQVFGYFEHKGNQIRFWKFSHPSANESASDNNIEFDNAQELNKWGYYTLNDTFRVERLTKNLLIMKSDSVKIKYIKF